MGTCFKYRSQEPLSYFSISNFETVYIQLSDWRPDAILRNHADQLRAVCAHDCNDKTGGETFIGSGQQTYGLLSGMLLSLFG